jgi:hypothetical protein
MRRRPTNKDGFLSYEAAKAHLKELQLLNSVAYKAWAYSNSRPSYIPVAPESVYQDEWKGWADYLSRDPKIQRTKRRPPKDTQFMSFEEARIYIRVLRLRSVNDFKIWAAGPSRPIGFPSNPDLFYREVWRGYRDFLGIETLAFISYDRYKAIVNQAELKTEAEFRSWASTERRPNDCPSNPDKYYKEDWLGWRAFLD